MDFVRGQPFGVDAKIMLELQAVAKELDIHRPGKNEEVTAFAIANLLADLVLKTLKHR